MADPTDKTNPDGYEEFYGYHESYGYKESYRYNEPDNIMNLSDMPNES